MALAEFDIIQQFFTQPAPSRRDVALGVGDDAALLRVPPGQLLAVSMDTLIAGVHFPIHTPAAAVGHKALAVNLSDMAAMGVEPAWITLALTLPTVNKKWLRDFATGFFELAKLHHLQLVGGDLTRGAQLSITAQLHGLVPPRAALKRSGAQVGDRIYVTGTLGDAGAALQLLKRAAATHLPDYLKRRLDYPTPRIVAGLALRGLATSAIDISDGLAADLGHVLRASQVGATLWVEQLPLSAALRSVCNFKHAAQLALGSGDDYELCFTVPAHREKKLQHRFAELSQTITCIGVIETTPGLRLQTNTGKNFVLKKFGFRHF